MKMNKLTKLLTRFWNNSKSTIIKHGPQIMAAAGAGCFIAATVCAVKETPEAIACLEEKEDLDPDMTKLQRAAVVIPKYKKTLIFTGLGLGLTCGAWKMEAKQMAELAATASMALSDNDKLKKAIEEGDSEKAKETLNKMEEEKGVHHISEESIGSDPDTNPPTDKVVSIFRFDITGKCFYSTMEKVEEALSNCRAKFRRDRSVSMKEVYRENGLAMPDLDLYWPLDQGDTFGFSEADVRQQFSWDFRPFKDDYGRLGWNIVFNTSPISD